MEGFTNLNLSGVILERIMVMILYWSFSDKEADLDFCIAKLFQNFIFQPNADYFLS